MVVSYPFLLKGWRRIWFLASSLKHTRVLVWCQCLPFQWQTSRQMRKFYTTSKLENVSITAFSSKGIEKILCYGFSINVKHKSQWLFNGLAWLSFVKIRSFTPSATASKNRHSVWSTQCLSFALKLTPGKDNVQFETLLGVLNQNFPGHINGCSSVWFCDFNLDCSVRCFSFPMKTLQNLPFEK